MLSPAGEVFLFRSDNSEVGVHWNAPGGGLEPGESPVEGALRELHEETDWTDLRPGPLVCTWEHDFTWHGIPVRQHEHIFLTHGPRREPGDVAAVHRVDGILGWRWWTPDELTAPDADPTWPPNLAALLPGLRNAGAGPIEPVHLGHVPNTAPRTARP